MDNIAMMRADRLAELEFSQWKAQRDIRIEAVRAAVAMTADERAQFGGVVETSKLLAEYLRDG